jgi:hypothetical protein
MSAEQQHSSYCSKNPHFSVHKKIGGRMSILNEIQSAVLDPTANMGAVLLKLRFLASRLGNDQFADWVKYEAEGYPESIAVPEYRVVNVSFSGTFSGGFGTAIKNAPIPQYLIEKYAGKGWVRREIRSSIAAVDHLVSDKDGDIGINAQNLMLVLQDKIYEGYACNSITGSISRVEMSEILTAVRSRVLELTMELEKSIPEAAEVEVARPAPKNVNSAQVSHIFHQTVYGNLTHVNASDKATVNFSANKGDASALIEELIKRGIPQESAQEFAEIVASETPASSEQPLGTKAVAWISKNLSKAANGTWKVGVAVGTKVLEEAAMRYYGFK